METPPSITQTIPSRYKLVEYTLIKQQILQIKNGMKANGFLFFVAIPTLIASFYYLLIAADIYVSEGKFSLEISDATQVATNSGALGSVLGGANGNTQKLYLIKEFVRSGDMIEKLEKAIGLKSIYNSSKADFFSKLVSNASQEKTRKYFEKMVELRFEEHTSIMFLRVKAFSAEDAKLIADEILKISEDFVNNMSKTMREDAISFSHSELGRAEEKLLQQNKEITEFRNKNKNYNPLISTQNVLQNTASLESQLSSVETEIADLRNYMRADSPRVQALQARAEALKKQITGQGNKLASEKGSKLATLTQSYSTLELANQFALRRYEISAASLEAAQVEARKKSVYLVRIDNPSKPDIAVEPEKMKGMFTTFFICLIVYVMVRVSVSSIIDHIRR